MNIRFFADGYARIEGLTAEARRAISDALLPMTEFTDIVPGISSVTARFDPTQMDRDNVRELLSDVVERGAESAAAEGAVIPIPVVYGGADGPNLQAVAERLGLTPAQVIDQHASETYRVDLIGFTAGFAYLTGLSPALDVPRLEHPARYVKPGSIGIADGRCGIYALGGPGGWPIIARTRRPLVDMRADPPFLLTAGARIEFIQEAES